MYFHGKIRINRNFYTMKKVNSFVCAFFGCPNGTWSRNNEYTSFHMFPKDVKLQKSWVRSCKAGTQIQIDTSKGRVCSMHFTADDYERDLKAELMGLPSRKQLKSGSIPRSIQFHQKTENLPKCAQLRAERQKKREQKELVEMLLSMESEDDSSILDSTLKANETPDQTTDDVLLPPSVECTAPVINPDDSLLPSEEINSVDLVPVSIPENSIPAISTNEDDYKDMYLKQLEAIEALQKELAEEKRRSAETEQVLSKVFTLNQLKILKGERKQVRWSTEEISKAFTLRYLSLPAYDRIRKDWNIPLPGISTLQRWSGTINIRSGILHDVLRMMAVSAAGKDNFDNICVLSFDEMKVKETIEFDEKAQEFVGPHKQVQIAMVRGLCKPFKQPVFVDFDRKMTKSLVDEILTKLHNAGHIIVAMVSDMGGSNVGLWRELKITPDKPWFEHPVTGQLVIFLPDVCHLLKLLRNWILDNGFQLSDGRMVHKLPIVQLWKLSSKKEVSATHKLTEVHVKCIRSQRQNVELAAQLISNSVGSALIRYKHILGGGSQLEQDVAQCTGEFLLLMNKWFDLFNVYIPERSTPFWSPYGYFLEEQNALLEEVRETIAGMTPIPKRKRSTPNKRKSSSGKNESVVTEDVGNQNGDGETPCKKRKTNNATSSTSPSGTQNMKTTPTSTKKRRSGDRKTGLELFQKGIIMTTNALPKLLEQVREYGVAYILTHRLNQDLLENLFCQLRSKGGLHDHPEPLTALYRLRLILLGKNSTLLKKNTNTCVPEKAADERFITSDFVSQLDINPDIASVVPTVLPQIDLISEETDTASEVDRSVDRSYDLNSSVHSDLIPPSQGSGGSNLPSDQEVQSYPRVLDPRVSHSEVPEMEEDGMQYLAGWLAFKFSNKYPELRKKKGKTDFKSEHGYGLPPWVSQLSFGGLTVPSPRFVRLTKRMNRLLDKLIKPQGTLPKGKRVLDIYTKKITKRMGTLVPEDVVRRFIKIRLIIRMRYIIYKGAIHEAREAKKITKMIEMKKVIKLAS